MAPDFRESEFFEWAEADLDDIDAAPIDAVPVVVSFVPGMPFVFFGPVPDAARDLPAR